MVFVAARGLAGGTAAGPGLVAGEAWTTVQAGPLLTFEQAGQCRPNEVLLTVSANGSATGEPEAGGRFDPERAGLPSRRRRARRLRSLLAGAGLPHLAATYGAPNPGGVFSVLTSAHKSVEVFAEATEPAGLRRLDAYLDRVTKARDTGLYRSPRVPGFLEDAAWSPPAASLLPVHLRI